MPHKSVYPDRDHPLLAVPRTLAQTIDLGHRDTRQPIIALVAEVIALALQDLLCGRSAERLVRCIHAHQQRHVPVVVQRRETVTPAALNPHVSILPVASDQTRDLCAAQPRHLLHIPPHQTARRTPQLVPVLLPQAPAHPSVNLLLFLAREMYGFAGFQKSPDLVQAHSRFVAHFDRQYPAWPIPSPGSSCMRNSPSLQAHPA